MQVNSYINLHWVAKLDKDLSLPIVVFDDNYEAGGCCCLPRRKEILIHNRYYPLDKGLIIIDNDPDYSIEWIGGALAHEWRHLWQYYKGYKHSYHPWSSGSKENYKTRIIKYFLNDPLEYDALLYERKMSNSSTIEEWYSWINKAKGIKNANKP